MARSAPPRHLQLHRLAPTLRSVGVDVAFHSARGTAAFYTPVPRPHGSGIIGVSEPWPTIDVCLPQCITLGLFRFLCVFSFYPHIDIELTHDRRRDVVAVPLRLATL